MLVLLLKLPTAKIPTSGRVPNMDQSTGLRLAGCRFGTITPRDAGLRVVWAESSESETIGDGVSVLENYTGFRSAPRVCWPEQLAETKAIARKLMLIT